LTLERVVRPAGPFSLALCTKHASDATRHVRDGTLTTTLRLGERVELGSARQTLDGRVVLRADSEDGLDRLRFVLAVDADHSEFLRRFARDPMIGEATLKF
jgi:hypothetical protein